MPRRNPEQDIARIVLSAKDLEPPEEEFPTVRGIDIYGRSIPLNDTVGGDHITYVDFKGRYYIDDWIRAFLAANQPLLAEAMRKNKHRAGILLIDVEGHGIAESATAARFHDAFLLGVRYELEIDGEVRARLLGHLNNRFFNSLNGKKTLTAQYGEIHESGTFRFVSSGHPAPLIFSYEFGKFTAIAGDRYPTCHSIGLAPSPKKYCNEKPQRRAQPKDRYDEHQIDLLGNGDMIIMHSDGLSDHGKSVDRPYVPGQLEIAVRRAQHKSARDIFYEVKADIEAWAPRTDDITYIIIKKNI